MRHSRPYLFSDYELRDTFQNKLRSMQTEIDGMDDDRMLNTNITDMVEYLEEKYKFEPLELDDSGITVDQNETQIDVSGDRDRYISDRSRPFHVQGTSNRFLYLLQETPIYSDAGLHHIHQHRQPEQFRMVSSY